MGDLDEAGRAWGLLRAVEAALADAVPSRVVSLCRIRVATLLDNPDEVADARSTVPADLADAIPQWPTSSRFGDDERAHLALAEQLAIDGSGVDDALVGALAAHRSPEEIYIFVRWVQANEARQRAQLLLRHHSQAWRFA
jgi:alkylhydroperoxidase family enzyme